MMEAVLFGIVFVGFFVLRGVAATVVFYFLLPDSDHCPICDEHTLHVHSRFWRSTIPGLRPSWCPRCRWEGMLRRPRESAPSGWYPSTEPRAAEPHVPPSS